VGGVDTRKTSVGTREIVENAVQGMVEKVHACKFNLQVKDRADVSFEESTQVNQICIYGPWMIVIRRENIGKHNLKPMRFYGPRK